MRTKKIALVGISFLVLLGACSTSSPDRTTGPADNVDQPTTPDRESKIANLWPNENYEKLSRQMIEEHGQALISKTPLDIQSICSSYTSYDRETKIDFLVMVLSVMAKYESNFDTNKAFLEPQSLRDSRGNRVTSRGLLQLSIESARGYSCVIQNEQELHKPEKNLECGVRILNRWLDRDGYLLSHPTTRWRGGARYWSVLRSTNTWNKNLLSDIRSRCL